MQDFLRGGSNQWGGRFHIFINNFSNFPHENGIMWSQGGGSSESPESPSKSASGCLEDLPLGKMSIMSINLGIVILFLYF